MKKRVLFIEDHQTMIEGYKSLLSLISGFDFDFESCHSCEEVYRKIQIEKKLFDVVFLDLIVPSFPEGNLDTGEDVGKLIRDKISGCKLLIITSHAERLQLYSVYKNLNPDALLVKSEFSSAEFIKIVEHVLNGHKILGPSAEMAIKEIKTNELFLDKHNRDIIFLISKGIKTKNIADQLKLSVSSVDKRKAFVKEYLGITKGSDEDIVREARKKYLI